MGLKAVRVCLILVISLVVFFPGLTSSLAFSAVEIPQRVTDVPTTDEDKNGAIGIEKQSSVNLGSSDQELVKLTNNMSSTKQTKVELENTYNWQIADSEGVSRSLNPSQSTTYNVDTSEISSSPSNGNYTISMIEGSFVITADRTVIFEVEDVLQSDQSIVIGGTTIDGNGSSEQNLNLKNAGGLGSPSTDLTGNGRNDLPYVSSSGKIKIVDSEGNEQTLGGNKPRATKSKTLLAVGQWQGSPPSVFFANKGKDAIYRVAPGGSKVQVATPPNGVQAVSGVADIDDDQTVELVFVDSSQQLRYLESNGDTKKVQGGGLGSSSGIGAGSPPDLNNNGIPRILGVDGSNNIILAGVAEPSLTISNTNSAKSPVTNADIDGDNQPEILYIGNQNNYVKYVDNPLSGQQVKTVTNDQGDPVVGNPNIGVVSS